MAEIFRVGSVGRALSRLTADPSRIREVAAVIVTNDDKLEIVFSHASITLLGGVAWLHNKMAGSVTLGEEDPPQ